MKCSVVNVGGTRMIVCGPRRIKVCCVCGAPATKECDWKMRKLPSGRVATCDKGLCDAHTFSPAPEKDLCPPHRKAWEEHPANKQDALPLQLPR